MVPHLTCTIVQLKGYTIQVRVVDIDLYSAVLGTTGRIRAAIPDALA